MVILGVFEESIHIVNQLLLMYLIKGCEFNLDYRKIVGALLLSFFSFTIYELYNTTVITLFLNMLIEVYIFMSVIKLRTKDKCVWFLVVSFLETFLIVIVNLILADTESTKEVYGMFETINGLVAFLIIATITTWKHFKYRNLKLESTNLYIQIYLTLGLLSGTFLLLGVDLFGDNMSVQFIIALVTLAFLITIANALLYVFYIKKQRESIQYKATADSLELSLQLQEKRFTDMVNSYTDLRRFRHDVNGYLNTINLLIEDHNYKELIEFTKDVQKSIVSTVLISCDNVYISASIHQFLGLMDSEKIKFIFKYNVRGEIQIKNYHLCSLLYNLMSNAVEAAIKCNEDRSIRLVISHKNDAIIIEIANSVNSDFSLDDLKIGKTSKEDKDNHGLGMLNIQYIVDKYNGNIDWDVEKNQLQISIVILEKIKLS